MNKTQKISIVVPTWNEEGNIELLLARIDKTLPRDSYEVIFIDDNSSDKTREVINLYKDTYPLKLFIKKGRRGKARSLIQGFKEAKYDLIAMIDADLQYPPESLPSMLQKINEGSDIVVAERKNRKVNFTRHLASSIYRKVFVKGLHGINHDSQSGLKIFKKEIIQRIKLNPLPWSFDLEFLTKARNAGYVIDSVDIDFEKRFAGKTKVNFFTVFQLAYTSIKMKLTRSEPFVFTDDMAMREGNGFHFKGVKYIHHTNLPHKESAFRRFSFAQILVILVLIALFLFWTALNWHAAIVVAVAALTVLYFADLLFNLLLVIRSFTRSTEMKISDDDIKSKSDDFWPTYTIFCPLYKEWEVIPQFVTAITNLEYPKDKLQVMLLLEENDPKTLEHARAMDLPDCFEIIIVPDSIPKTKPKACNYGLTKAKGEFSVIYDAEDVPDPLQLKKAYLAFQKLGPEIACVQAKLNFYNPHQNILTRVFTAEYSLWFDLVLTGLQSVSAPIPLGGTSNHFKTQTLRDLKGWDSFNVTEDCDLGMRIAKRGMRTMVIDSMTLEEANSDLKNWFHQRTRWIKGYIQTYFVHMRKPREFINHWREPHVITFQLVVGGKVLSMLINPFMWTITVTYFLLRPIVGSFIESFFPAPVLYMAVFSLIIGNFLYMYYYMIGCAKREYYDIIKYAFLVPFYWLGMSLAAFVALFEFLVNPHHWSKTKHGLHLGSGKVLEQSEENIKANIVDRSFVNA